MKKILDMKISTDRIPLAHIECNDGSQDGTITCTITDIATKSIIAKFEVGDELKEQIPQLLQLYLR